MPKDDLITIDMKTFDKNIKDTIDNLSKLEDDVNKDIMRLVRQACNIIVKEAKINHPFINRSTNLERSIHSKVSKLADDIIKGQIGSWLDYAYWVEVGQEKRLKNVEGKGARPYLLPAFEKKFEEVVDYIVKGLRKILEARGIR